MTGFTVEFLGCKISQTDAEAIRDALVDAGHEPASASDLHVVNTCCITAEAEKKSRQKVRRAARSGQRVFVTGCGATLHPDAYRDEAGLVTVLPGAATLHAPTIVAEADRLAALGCAGVVDPATGERSAPGRVDTVDRSRRTRAFVKVQDGCSFTCSYCIVPTVRGSSRSRDVDAILAEVARRVERGQREVVLTGVNIGLYRDEHSRISLAKLLPMVADVPGVHRVRVSSIEVNHVSPRLVDAMASHPKVCPHLHVPLQSGDDDVLEGMRRHYRTRRYRSAIEHARTAIPHLNLTTDIIVGYPTEDDASFERTMAFAAEMGFTKIHAFPYSPRPGTRAEEAANPVPAQVKSSRSAALRVQADGFARRHWSSRVGSRDEVVVEHGASRAGMALTSTDQTGASSFDAVDDGPRVGGYTRDYCPVRLTDADAVPEGELVTIEVTGFDDRGLVASLA